MYDYIVNRGTLAVLLLENLLRIQIMEFIAVAVSPWHAIGVDAEVIRGNYKSGIVLIFPHPKDGYLITPGDLICSKESDIKFLQLKSLKVKSKLLRYIDMTKGFLNLYRVFRWKRNNALSTLRLISPMKPSLYFVRLFSCKSLFKYYHPAFTVIDEGMGTYFSRQIWHGINKREQPCSTFPLLKPFYSSVDYLLENIIPYEKRFLFKRDMDGTLIHDSSVATYYSQALQCLAKKLNGTVENLENAALVVTQPFSEYGYVPYKTELYVMEKVVDTIINNGLRAALKPHPREKIEKYAPLLERYSKNVTLLPQMGAVETIVFKLQPKLIVGFTSTALMTCNALFNVPSYTAIKFLYEVSPTNYIQQSCEEFLRLSSRCVHTFAIK